MRVAPTTTATKATLPAPSPVPEPNTSSSDRSSHCSSVITTEMGMSRAPIPTKRRTRLTYTRPLAARIWPQLRRRPRRSGATGVHVALTATSTTRPISPASRRSIGTGLRSSWLRALEPFATPEQKTSVAPVPTMPPVGTA